MRMAKVGVWLDRVSAERHWSYGLNVFGVYAEEILREYGIPFETFPDWETAERSRYDMIVVAHAPDDALAARRLREFAESGGVVVSYAGIRSLARGLGCRERPAAPVGYAELPPEFGEPVPLRYLRAVPWQNGEKDEAPLLLSLKIGEGWVERWSVDIPYTVVGLQQGTSPVLRDGVPAPDGSGDLDEGILKADDECALDWETDRLSSSAGSPYFAHPYADLWKDAMAGHLIRCAYRMGLALPYLGFWPDGVTKVAMVSHDSDGNRDEHAVSTLEALEACGIRSTWCILEPGYSSNVYDKIKRAGHELAFHYNALEEDGGLWSQGEFSRQLAAVKEAMGVERVVSNKNHFTRLEGWGELFRWCEEHGIEVDQTRGPSKRGNVGFPFGTCRPYRPIAWSDEKNRLYQVLEIGFQTQDLDHGYWSDSSIVEPLLDQAEKAQGIAHFLFHQIHIHGLPSVRNAMAAFAASAKSRGFEFWTSEQVWAWEKARRSVRIAGIDGEMETAVTGDATVRDLVVWVPERGEGRDGVETKFGVPCRKQVLHYSLS